MCPPKKDFEVNSDYKDSLDFVIKSTDFLFEKDTYVVQLYCYIYPVAQPNIMYRKFVGECSNSKHFLTLNENNKIFFSGFFTLYLSMFDENSAASWNKSLITIIRDSGFSFKYKFDQALSLFEINRSLNVNCMNISKESENKLFDW